MEKNNSYSCGNSRIHEERKAVGWLCMEGVTVVIHNPNTEEESFKLASYLFMAGNMQIAMETVNRELKEGIDVAKAMDKQMAV